MDISGKDQGEQIEIQKDSTLKVGFLNLDNHTRKLLLLLKACEGKDLNTLRELATSEGGLLVDSVRRQAWLLLLGVTKDDWEPQPKGHTMLSIQSLAEHPDEDQVRLDVNRSFVHYPIAQSPKDLLQSRNELYDLITYVLRHLSYLSYFQGYHDICQVFMLVLEPQSCGAALARLSALKIRDFMLPNFSHALAQLQLILSIIRRVNFRLWNHLSTTQPYFALSGILTMFSHDIQKYDDITRLFDVLLARETVFSLYLFAQIVLQRTDELLKIPSDEPEILHSVLSRLPNPLGVETLIKNTVKLIETHPPEILRGWSSISNNSVLKTTRWPDQIVRQSLEDGQIFFFRQVNELKWEEKRRTILKVTYKYWKPILTISFSVLIGVLSYWLRKLYTSAEFLGFLPSILKFMKKSLA